MDITSALRASAELPSLAVIRRFVEQTATALGASRGVIDDMVQAAEESAANIILHGYRGQPGTIEIEIWKEGDALVVCLRDQAPPFDPTTYPPPDLTLPLEHRSLGGLGIHLVRQFTDAMTHRVTPEGGNELTLMKRMR